MEKNSSFKRKLFIWLVVTIVHTSLVLIVFWKNGWFIKIDSVKDDISPKASTIDECSNPEVDVLKAKNKIIKFASIKNNRKEVESVKKKHEIHLHKQYHIN